MPKFGASSMVQRATCDERLQRIFDYVVIRWDCVWLEGKRSEAQQRINVIKKVSKTMESKHVYPLESPSLAADVAPYPVRWPIRPPLDTPPELMPKLLSQWAKDTGRFYYFAGYVLGVADMMNIPLIHGGDWNGNRDVNDQVFDDLPHFQIVE